MVRYFTRIVCQQTILKKYHALFVIFEKVANLLLQIIGGALRVNMSVAYIQDAHKDYFIMKVNTINMIRLLQSISGPYCFQ